MPIRVAVAGAAGKMGLAVCEAVEAAHGLVLAARVDPALGVELTDVLGEVDVVVDFTRPDVALANIQACIAAGVHAVVGTTGFDLAQVKPANGAKVLIAPNFAIGAVLLMQFSQQAAKHMPKVEIIELHHDQKLDAPSGTAARTARMIRDAGGPADVPIHSVRLPGIIANQEVIFGEVGQTLTIRHDTTDRRSFMPGVVLAVRKVATMEQDLVVGLEHLLD
ncbi:MAG: dihydrodipicolinate reductase C-terminal domain-containing protein [Patulibacter sp.]